MRGRSHCPVGGGRGSGDPPDGGAPPNPGRRGASVCAASSPCRPLAGAFRETVRRGDEVPAARAGKLRRRRPPGAPQAPLPEGRTRPDPGPQAVDRAGPWPSGGGPGRTLGLRRLPRTARPPSTCSRRAQGLARSLSCPADSFIWGKVGKTCREKQCLVSSLRLGGGRCTQPVSALWSPAAQAP